MPQKHSRPIEPELLGVQPGNSRFSPTAPGEWFSCCCYLVAQSCLTLCDPMDSSPPGSSVYGVSQTRLVVWSGKPCPPPGNLPDPRIKPTSPALASRFFFFFTTEPPGKPMGRQSWKPVNAIKGDIRKDLKWNNKISVQIEISKLLLSSNLNEEVIFLSPWVNIWERTRVPSSGPRGELHALLFGGKAHYTGLFWITLAFLSLVKKWQKIGCPWNDSFELEIICNLWT